ncbi:MAG: hypothetical protein WDN69_16735 [Aliidongia sp.]
MTDDPEPAEFEHFEINIAAIGSFLAGGRQGALPNIDANYGARPGSAAPSGHPERLCRTARPQRALRLRRYRIGREIPFRRRG